MYIKRVVLLLVLTAVCPFGHAQVTSTIGLPSNDGASADSQNEPQVHLVPMITSATSGLDSAHVGPTYGRITTAPPKDSREAPHPTISVVTDPAH